MSTRREIFEDTAKEVNINLGKGIRGKGTEVWELQDPYLVFSQYENKNKEEVIKALEKAEDVYVDQITYKDSGSTYSFNCQSVEDVNLAKKLYPIGTIIRMIKENRIISLVVGRSPKLLGYVPLSHYDTSFESQKDFIERLLELKGYEVEWDEERLINLDDSNYKRDGYEIVHGYPLVADDAEYFDGRSWDYSDIELEDFWANFDGSIFDDIDPDEDITVYHRKGKDWYVAPSAEDVEVTLYYENDEGEEDWEVQIAYIYKKDEELINKALDTLSSIKEDLIVWSKADIDLGIDVYLSCENGEIANLNIIDNEYGGDRWAARDDISSYFMEANNNYELAYHMFLEDSLDEREYLFGKYKHLPMAREMFAKKGMRLISPKDKHSPYVVEYKGESYHFYLGVLYKVSPQDFVKDISEKLKRRINEKLAKKYIYKNASKVFVSVKDSLDAGNCKFGTQDFIKNHHIDPNKIGGIRGDVLLEMANKDEANRKYIERAVLVALKRLKGEVNEKDV